jgi:WD40 repeat protein
VAFSPDSRTVAAGGPDGKVRLWDVATGKLKETLEGHGSEVYSVAFSPDGKTLASVSQDQTIRLWRMGRRVAEKK